MPQPVSIQQPQHNWGALTVPMVDGVNPVQTMPQTTTIAPPPAPTTLPDVAVIHPDGRRGTIPAANLAQAIKLGYKQSR